MIAAPPGALSSVLHASTGVVSRAAPPGVDPPDSVRRVRLIDRGPPSSRAVRMRPIADAAGRVARILLQRSVGVALGGGAALALAHLGVLEVLHELELPIDYLGGTSMGAALAALTLVRGVPSVVAEMRRRNRLRDWLEWVDPTVLVSGTLSGRRMLTYLQENLPDLSFGDLPIPFTAIAMDIESGEEHALREGPVADAVRASIAIPGVIAPHGYVAGGRRYANLVDGGWVNNVPVDVVRAMGADRVIGVHVLPRRLGGGARGDSRTDTVERAAAKIAPRTREAINAQFIAMSRSGERQVFTADVAVLPDTSRFALLDFWRGDELAEAGRAAARALGEQLEALAGRSAADAHELAMATAAVKR